MMECIPEDEREKGREENSSINVKRLGPIIS